MIKNVFVLSISLIILCASQVWAVNYYVRPHVTDAACTYGGGGGCDGLTYATAWEGFAGGDGTAVNWGTVNSGNGTLYVAGTHRELLVVGASGESGYPINIVSCTVANGASTNDPGIIDGSDLVAVGSWTADGADWYWEPPNNGSGSTQIQPMQVWENNVRMTFTDPISGGGQWNYDTTSSPERVYIRPTDGTLNDEVIEVGQRARGIAVVTKEYITVDGLTVEKIAARGDGTNNPFVDAGRDYLAYSVYATGWGGTCSNIIFKNLTVTQSGGDRSYYDGPTIASPTVNNGTADATSCSGSNLVDADETFTTDMVGMAVHDTVADTFTYVTAFVSSSELTLNSCIITSGENYDLGWGTDWASAIETWDCDVVEVYNNTVSDGTCCAFDLETPNVVDTVAMEVYNNTATDFEGACLWTPFASANVYNNIFTNCGNSHPWTSQQRAVHIGDVGDLQYNFYNNRVTNSDVGVRVYGRQTSNLTISYNIVDDFTYSGIRITNNSDDVDVFNNVIYDTGGSTEGAISVVTGDTSCDDVVIKNNIIYVASHANGLAIKAPSADSDPTISNNLYYINGASVDAWNWEGATYDYATEFSNWESASGDSDSDTADPLFVNAAAGNFHRTTSTAGTNVSLTTDYEGAAVSVPNIGAFENTFTGYYVRPLSGEYGAENGSTYKDAYDGFADIVWADVDSGNGKLFVAGTHREQLVVGASGEDGTPIIIQSYDTDPAILLGSTIMDETGDWTSIGSGVWRTTATIGTTADHEIGFVLFGSESQANVGTRVSSEGALDAEKEFFSDITNHYLKVYTNAEDTNPYTFYGDVEIGYPFDADGDCTVVRIEDIDYVTVDGLTIKYANAGGIQVHYDGTGCNNIIVQNCTLSYGGGMYDDAQSAQFGNGIAILGSASSVSFLDNAVTQWYDIGLGLETGNGGNAISNVTIDGNTSTYNAIGIGCATASGDGTFTNVVISNNTVDYSGTGWGGTGVGINLQEADCTANLTCDGVDNPWDCCTGDDTGVDGTYSTASVYGNTVSNTTGWGLRIKDDGIYTIYDNSITGSSSHGFFIGWESGSTSTAVADVSAYRNLIYDNTGNGFQIITNTDIDFYYNIVYGNALEGFEATSADGTINILNNAFYDNGTDVNDAAVKFTAAADAGTYTIKNNILVATGNRYTFDYPGSGNFDRDYNIYYNTTGSSQNHFWRGTAFDCDAFATPTTGWQALESPDDANSYCVDPLFVSATDFHLTSTSPAKDVGTDVSLTADYDGINVPQGAGFDIGAYEYLGTTYIQGASTMDGVTVQ